MAYKILNDSGHRRKAKVKTLLINENEKRGDALSQVKDSGFGALVANRQLLMMMVKRDSLGKYKGSLLGALWPLVNPLGHLILYTFLFSVILQINFKNPDGTNGNFALYLMSGLLPWGAFTESTSRASSIILEYPNLVKRVVFPLPILPLVTVLSPLVTEGMAFIMLLAGILVTNHSLPWTIVFIPVIALSQIILTAGIAWTLASLGVYIRDMKHIMALMLSAWMYATPIVYGPERVPETCKFLLWINPMAGIVMDYRRVLLQGLMPDWSHYAVYTLMGCIAFFIGFRFFDKTKKSFADVM